jgi:hypothetical protein
VQHHLFELRVFLQTVYFSKWVTVLFWSDQQCDLKPTTAGTAMTNGAMVAEFSPQIGMMGIIRLQCL